MAIFRGVGGSGDSSDSSYLQAITDQANAAEQSKLGAQNALTFAISSATAASDSATAASDSATSILNLTAATGDAGTNASYNASTGVLTIPRGDAGTDATVTTSTVEAVGAVMDGDFTSNGFMKRTGVGTYDVDTNTYLTAHQDISGKANLSGATFTGDVLFNDGVKAKFGTDSDLLIYHNNGEPSVIEDAGELGLILKTNGNIFAVISDTNESMITATPNEGVTLHYDGTSKVHVGEDSVSINEDLDVQTGNDLTVQGGDLDVTGNIIVSGTVDGVDVAGLSTTVAGKANLSGATFTGNVIVDHNLLYVDTTADKVGVGTASPQDKLHVNGTLRATDLYVTGGESYLCRTHSTTNQSLSTLRLCAISTGDMTDGFGTGITFDAEDNSGTTQAQVAEINAVRAGADNVFNLELQTGDVARLTLGTDGATFATGSTGTDRFRIDSSGNVGINTGSNAISEKLDVVGNIAVSGTVSASNVDISTSGSVTTNIATGTQSTQGDTKTLNLGTGYSSQATTNVNIGADTGTTNIRGNLTVDGTGNVVGNLTVDGTIDATIDTLDVTGGESVISGTKSSLASAVLDVRNDTLVSGNNSGTIITLTAKDGSVYYTKGAIGTSYSAFVGAQYSSPYFAHTATNYDSGIRINSAGSTAYNGMVSCDADGQSKNNTMSLGSPAYKWVTVYATTGSINTSDQTHKRDVEELSEAETRVAVACKGLLRKYRWKDAYEEKGEEARIHFGIMAQDLRDAFSAEGLDASRYAMFCSDTWWEDETGERHEEQDLAPEGAVETTQLGVRYDELLAFIIAAI